MQKYHGQGADDEFGGHLRMDKSRQTFEKIYNALDVIAEKCNSGKEQVEADDGFVGCLAVFGTVALYGSVTHGGYKVVVGVSDGGDQVDSLGGALRTAFGKIGDALIAAQLNPMRDTERPLRSRKLRMSVGEVVRWYG